MQNYKFDEKKANKQITDAISSRYNQKVTSNFYQVTELAYLLPLETILTMPYDKLIRVHVLVLKAAKTFISALAERRLVLESGSTPLTNSIGYEGLCSAYSTQQNLERKE